MKVESAGFLQRSILRDRGQLAKFLSRGIFQAPLQFLLGTLQFYEDNFAASRLYDFDRIRNKTFTNSAFRIECKNKGNFLPRRLSKGRKPNLFPQANERLTAKREE